MVTGRSDSAAAFPYKFIDGLSRRQQEQIYEDLLFLARKGSGTRWGTIVIAPSDATTASKDKADVLLDGTTDSVKVNAAIAALTGRNLGGRVVFLEGTVYLTTPISFTLGVSNYLKIEGQGSSTKLQATGDAIDVVNGTLEVDNLAITTGAIGISGNATGLYVNKVRISGGTDGIVGSGAFVGATALITDCTVSATSRGIRMVNMDTTMVTGNTVVMSGGTGRGIDLNANSGYLVKSIVTNNFINGTGGWGIDCNNGSADATDVKQTLIGHNKIVGGFTFGIAFNGNDGVLVNGNFISGCNTGIGVIAVGITQAVNVFITGNYVVDSTGTHISASTTTLGTSNFAILFNKCQGTTPAYAITIGGFVSDAAVAYNDTWNGYSTAAVLDGGINTRRESYFLGPTLDTNARVGVRKNSGVSTFLRRRLNLIEGTDFSITAADDSVDEEVDITLGLAATISSNARVGVRKNTTGSTFTRRRINFIEGSGITLTVADDSVNEEVDVTINQAAGAGSGDTEGQFIAEWDGGGATIDSSRYCDVQAPFAGTIDSWKVYTDVADTVSIEVWKDVYANYPPTVADKISAAAPITLTATDHNSSSALTGWTTAVTAGDVLRFKISTLAVAKKLKVVVHYTRP